MRRRFVCGLVIAASTGMAGLIAQERATFILTSGERKSGVVVAHGDERANLINGFLNLGDGSGKEETFRESQVAVISFVGGQPPTAELEALPAGNTHVLARKNGSTEPGRFINIINGDTLKWRNSSGDQVTMSVTDVARIYLNPDSARTTFNVTARPASTPVAPPATVLEPGAVRVNANQAWTASGVTVRAGDAVSFRATGRVNFGQGETQTAGPDGNDSLRNGSYPVPAMPVGGLIGRVGNSAPFPIGSNTEPIRMPANGELMLGVNDNQAADNGGFFSVVVNGGRTDSSRQTPTDSSRPTRGRNRR